MSRRSAFSVPPYFVRVACTPNGRAVSWVETERTNGILMSSRTAANGASLPSAAAADDDETLRRAESAGDGDEVGAATRGAKRAACVANERRGRAWRVRVRVAANMIYFRVPLCCEEEASGGLRGATERLPSKGKKKSSIGSTGDVMSDVAADLRAEAGVTIADRLDDQFGDKLGGGNSFPQVMSLLDAAAGQQTGTRHGRLCMLHLRSEGSKGVHAAVPTFMKETGGTQGGVSMYGVGCGRTAPRDTEAENVNHTSFEGCEQSGLGNGQNEGGRL